MMSVKVQSYITQRIIDLIDSADGLVWRKPWVVAAPRNLVTKRPYRGVNRLMTSLTALIRGYSPRIG